VVILRQNLHKFHNHRAEGPEFAKVDRDQWFWRQL